MLQLLLMQIKSLKSVGLFILVEAICAGQTSNIKTYLSMHHFIMQTCVSKAINQKNPSLKNKMQVRREI